MLSEKTKKTSQVGWNGIRLTTHSSWETHIGGRNHLIFEKDFTPLMEVRWQKAVKKNNPNSKAILKRIQKADGTLHKKKLPPGWSFLEDNYHVTCYGRLQHLPFDTGVSVCKHCQTILLFKLSNQTEESAQLLKNCLRTISCHKAEGERELWALQDFQLWLPQRYSLIDYSLVAGLSRISFSHKRIILHTCKLAPADSRLTSQPLEEILRSLTDIPNLQVQISDESKICDGWRTPTIGRQIALRFQRKKPFVQAKIRHDISSNRLLAVVLESIRPIPPQTSQIISDNYEIVQN